VVRCLVVPSRLGATLQFKFKDAPNRPGAAEQARE
jgi:hypothetical protein